MEIDYGAPATTVGGMVNYPEFTFANQPANPVAEQVDVFGSNVTTIVIGGSVTTFIAGR